MSLLFLLIIIFISAILTDVFRRYALQTALLDHPNERSSHTVPTPRGGGLVFVSVWVFFALFWAYTRSELRETIALFIFPSFLVALLGYWDDRRNLPAKWRFILQLAVSFLFLHAFTRYLGVYFHGWLFEWGRLGNVVIILALVWSINLYNFMDGTDGLSGAEAVVIFGVGGLLLWWHGAYFLAGLAWLLVAAVGGFLCFNWPCASLFMGDVGSSFLGFLVIPFALVGYVKYNLSLFVWVILYMAFWGDATLTLVRRLYHKERIYEAHKSHAYQRLHQAGYSHARVLWLMVGLNLLLSLLACWADAYPQYLLLSLIIATMLYLVFYGIVERKHAMYARL